MTVQYLDWLWRALHLDFGNSFYFRDTVVSLIASRMPVTLLLGAISLMISLVIAVPLASWRRCTAARSSTGWR